jgi:subtilisin family serine protease
MKKHCLAVFFGLAALIVMAFAAMAQTPSIPQWSDIPEKAMTADGMARIIVQVDVPDIDALTKASTSMHLPQDKDDNARAAREAMARADAALTRAVSAATREVLASLPGSSHRINRQYRFLPFVALDVAPDAFLVLQSNPRVTAISFDIPSPLPGHGPTPYPKSTPEETSPLPGDNDPARPSMDDTISLIGADKAWAKGYSGSGWYVAILDTGIRRTHQFFQGKTIVEACFSSNADCPNGQTSMTGTGAAAHYPSTYAGYDHGTHVAGTAAGNKPDGTLFGVARDPTSLP